MLSSRPFIHIQTYQSPVGEMLLGSYVNKLCLANWSDKKKSDRTNNRLIPCRHRIIGSDGTLTGYAGGLNAKKKLLALEKRE